uniref:Uncharacterized protein n=1 Tax=Anguilla anguilla TaxID=7936 RepID=A0A0E9RU75_ANGAN
MNKFALLMAGPGETSGCSSFNGIPCIRRPYGTLKEMLFRC